MRFSLISTLAALLILTSCINPAGPSVHDRLNPSETFIESDAPSDMSHDDWTFRGPWGYDKPENAGRSYPLLVSGRWGEGENQYFQRVAQEYPAFVLDYQKGGESDGRVLAQWIESARGAGYRIDENRIYLTGFSWGGSDSFPLAKGVHAQGLDFAAVIRIAGQSQSDLGNDLADRTAVWYHIGLLDTETRVKVARDTLDFMRGYTCNSDARERSEVDTVAGYNRTTITLTRNGYPMFKYSEYQGMGHTSGPCYADEYLFPWLFSQSLFYR